MHAIEGDLLNPSSALNGKEWFDFDIVIISMALHHVEDPKLMLTKLKERVKRGGSIVVVEFLASSWSSSAPSSSTGNGPESIRALVEEHHQQQQGQQQGPRTMIETTGGQKIWPGFTVEGLKDLMVAVGCSDAEVRLQPEMSHFPEKQGGEMQIFYAKGRVN